jgi:hypothetical protein
LQKLANAAQKSFAKCTLLLDENRLLCEQNKEINYRKPILCTKVGEAKIMGYSESLETQTKRDEKEVAVQEGKR